MPDKKPEEQKAAPPGEYSFEVRFGSAAIAQGVVPLPRIVMDHYALLGVKDREMMWVAHLLAYKWTTADPFPSRKRLRCEASAKSQQRIAKHLRELGLLFTTRKYKGGRMVSLIYDLNSLLHNCVAIYELIEQEAKAHLVRTMVDPELASKWQWERAREQVLGRAAKGYKVELPPDVMERLKAGEYNDVPTPWSAYAPPPPNPDDLHGQQLLDSLFPPSDAMGLGNQPHNGEGENIAVPVAAGGKDSASGILLDGICQWNGLQDRTSLPEKKRLSQQRRIAAVIGQWGGATPEQAKLTWEAWTIRIAWPAVVNVYSKDWENKLGVLLLAVKEGSITEASLRSEAAEAGLKTTDRGAQTFNWAEYQQILEQRKARARAQGIDEMEKIPVFWRVALSELQLQMTAATFDTWLRNTDARMENGTVIVYCDRPQAPAWLKERLHDTVLRTLHRCVRKDIQDVDYIHAEAPPRKGKHN